MAEEQNPEGYNQRLFFLSSNQPTDVGAALRHIRRSQTGKKGQKKRDEAQRQASYARSLVGWNSPATANSMGSASSSQIPVSDSNLNSEDGNQMAQSPRLPPTIGGLRADSFASFPTTNTELLMRMVDYHIHVWSPHKYGAFEAYWGFNAYVDFSWPMALQDEMLFDATVTMCRVVFCLQNSISLADDVFILHHRGMAMAKLRERLSSSDVSINPELMFTIGTMVCIAYMENESRSFGVHLDAFRRLTRMYDKPQADETAVDVFNKNLQVWELIESFRAGADTIQNRWDVAPLLLHHMSTTDDLSLREPQYLSKLPIGFQDLISSGALCLDLVDVLIPLVDEPESLDQWRAKFSRVDHQLLRILVSHLSPFELQVCCGLLAYCLQLNRYYDEDAKEEDPDLLLKELSTTFINQKAAHEGPLQRECITWCATVLASSLLERKGLKTKGHVISMSITTLQAQPCTWRVLDPQLHKFLWHRKLGEQWKRHWETSMKRHKRWVEQGYLDLGIPQGHYTLIEHLVLRDARGTLPEILDD